MGNNLDLVDMFGLNTHVSCPDCRSWVKSYFDDYDIDCGEPFNHGMLTLSVSCSVCDHYWKQVYKVTVEEVLCPLPDAGVNREDIPPPGLYAHCHGGIYRVLQCAEHTDTGETVVVYASEETGRVYARPLSKFLWRVSTGFTPDDVETGKVFTPI